MKVETEGRKSEVEKVRYMISDAANLVNVESHVLRYWEDELELTIPRNEMGHRYYTKENIKEFQKIKELKDKGYQLKAIRMLIHNGNIEEFAQVENPVVSDAGQKVPQKGPDQVPEKMLEKLSETENKQNETALQMTEQGLVQRVDELQAEDRMAQFRELMADIVGHAISLNNEELSTVITHEVQERILKEMDFLAREKEDADEERFRKLDAAIRGNIQKKHSLFGRKEKKAKTEKSNQKRLPQ